jgi:ethanolamine utilization protein EutA
VTTSVEDPTGSEVIELKTVGIDIGSSTTHVMFARLRLERDGRHLSSRYQVVEREVTFRSDIHLTPFVDASNIDMDALGVCIAEEYRRAGVAAADVDTGAVIITGEAAMKHNADGILQLFAAEAGRFVCATAGPNLEASLAAHGSGAVALSAGATVLNVDIGGGTTKFAVVRDGRILQTAAVSLGARLVAWDDTGVVTRVETALGHYSDAGLQVGDVITPRDQEGIVATMAAAFGDVLDEILGRGTARPGLRDLYITDPLAARDIDAVCFSGGVSEYIHAEPAEERGDLGPALGAAISKQVLESGVNVAPTIGGIRATIIGASQYTVQVSGNTISVTGADLLPLRNVPVLLIDVSDDDGSFLGFEARVASAYLRNDLVQGRDAAAIGVNWPGAVDYATLARFCAVVALAMRITLDQEAQPLILLFDHDVAGLVGKLLAEEQRPRCPVISIDQLALEDWSYIDIGSVDEARGVVPIVMKSLIFK